MVVAQNLLTDGGFENLKSNLCLDPDDSFSRLQDWYTLDATPDLFVGNCTYDESEFVFWNENSEPFEGRNFVGIWSRWNSNSTYFSEGIATQFVEPLVAGETYQFEIMIKNRGGYQGLDDSVSGCSLEPEKHIDIYLSEDSIKVENNFSNGTASTTAALVASLSSSSITGGSNDNWMKVSACFTASGGEQFLGLVMPLGTFGELPPCAIVASSGVFRSFYYQLDAANLTVLPDVFTALAEKCAEGEIAIDINEYFDYEFEDTTLFTWEDGFVGGTRQLTENRLFEIEAALPCTDISLELSIEGLNCSSDVYIPTAFSPNKDGANDLFVVSFANSDMLSDYNLTIYDRWGSRIFGSTDPSTSWDGTFLGRDMSTGTYILQLSFAITTNDIVESHQLNRTIFLSR